MFCFNYALSCSCLQSVQTVLTGQDSAWQKREGSFSYWYRASSDSLDTWLAIKRAKAEPGFFKTNFSGAVEIHQNVRLSLNFCWKYQILKNSKNSKINFLLSTSKVIHFSYLLPCIRRMTATNLNVNWCNLAVFKKKKIRLFNQQLFDQEVTKNAL